MELGKTMDYSGFLDTIFNIQQPQSGGGGEDKIKTYKLWGTLSRKLKKNTEWEKGGLQIFSDRELVSIIFLKTGKVR